MLKLEMKILFEERGVHHSPDGPERGEGRRTSSPGKGPCRSPSLDGAPPAEPGLPFAFASLSGLNLKSHPITPLGGTEGMTHQLHHLFPSRSALAREV